MVGGTSLCLWPRSPNPRPRRPVLSSVHSVMRKAGGSYPPWSYAFGVLLVPPVEWQLTRWYLALLCVIALIVSAHCSYRWARPEVGRRRPQQGYLCSPISQQRSASVTAGTVCWLLGCNWAPSPALGGRREVLAGGLLGLAMVKPQLTGLLVLGLLLNGFFTTVAVVATLVGMRHACLCAGRGAMAVGTRPESSLRIEPVSQLSHNPLITALASVADCPDSRADARVGGGGRRWLWLRGV